MRGAQRAIAAKADEVQLVVSASETHNQHNVRRSVAESLVAAHEVAELVHDAGTPVEAIVSTAFGCPYEGEVAPERVAQVAGHLVDAGADRLSFGDTTGMATPRRVDELLDALDRAGIRSDLIGLHFHDTRYCPRQRARGARTGRRPVRRLDRRPRRLPVRAGRPGNAVTEDLVHMLGDLGVETGIDLDALIECARLAQEIVGRELPSAMLHAGPRLARAAGAA